MLLIVINFILSTVKPVIQVSHNTTVLVYEGNSTSFTCTATGSPRPAIIWSRTGNQGTLGIGGRIQKTEGIYIYYTILLRLLRLSLRQLYAHVHVDDKMYQYLYNSILEMSLSSCYNIYIFFLCSCGRSVHTA